MRVTGQLVRQKFSKMMYLSHYGSSQHGPAGQKVPVTLDMTGKQQIQGWSLGDIQFRTKRLNPSHEVAAADKTHLSWLGRIQGGPARMLKKETLEAQFHTSTAFLAVADAPNNSSALLAAIHVIDIHSCKSFNGVR